MNKKYFETKTGSLEDLATKIASKQSETKVEQKVKLESPKTYLGLKENSVTAVAARVVAEGFIKEEKFKADYTIEKRAPRHISDEEDEGESYGSITVSAKDAGEAKKKIEDEIDKRIDKMKKNPNLKGYSFEGYIDGSVQKISEALDPVNKDAVKKKFDDRKDKDIDNDGDTDSTDKYLHTRRSAISKNIKEDDMAKFHQMQKDGKSAEQIAKALGLDLNSVKKLMDLDEVRNPYAVGMAQAMKAKNDEPPLEKSTITKAHDIAKSIKRETKTFSDLRTETKQIQLGDKGKTLTGKKAAVIDVEPRAKPV